MNIGDTVQTINTLCPISGTVVEIYDNLIVISDDDAETDDDRLEFHVDDHFNCFGFFPCDVEVDGEVYLYEEYMKIIFPEVQI